MKAQNDTVIFGEHILKIVVKEHISMVKEYGSKSIGSSSILLEKTLNLKQMLAF